MSQLKKLSEAFAELNVSPTGNQLRVSAILLPMVADVVDKHARILDPHGRVIRDFSGTGLPTQLEFEVAAETDYFTLEVNGNQIHQGLSDTANVPPSQAAEPRAVGDDHDEVQPVTLEVTEIDATKEATDSDWLGFDEEDDGK